MATRVFDVSHSVYRSVTVTTSTALAGVAAGLVSAAVASGATDMTGLLIVGVFIFGQYPLLRVLGIDVEEFSKKDHLYVWFMTFSMWFVVWAILLTGGADLDVPLLVGAESATALPSGGIESTTGLR